ncbi:DASH family cryptochrome [Spirosoma fluviale]|uniref:Cryptochrome DASH n=1 Tax=Spirosoma fluviale TaxID=1597977 RepID=A0A286G100_9BACT|nr:DASH family cryptochrome [Spirosoma fluviale]SOD88654.1 deoxyribodipyrimidine photo-lyase [Spirosoma fluviale]
MNRILYWFRNDLRLHDNEGFVRALEVADEVLPIFVFDPRWFAGHSQLGFHRMSAFRANFLLESVADLRQSLRSRGADLIVRVGKPADVLSELAKEMGATAVYASKEVTQEETTQETRLSTKLKPLNIDFELFWMSTLYHVRDLPFTISQLPDVFSKFRQQLEKQVTIRSAFATPTRVDLVPAIDPGEIPSLSTLGFNDADVKLISEPDARGAVPFKGGETVALARLNRYLWQTDLIATYKETRNGLLGDDYSSKFSAWLANGCLSPRQVFKEIRRYESDRVRNDSTYWLIFELLWRDFFRFVALKFGSRIFKRSGIKHDLHKTFGRDEGLFRKWTEGQTGIPFIDANMREMNATGFMSNRGRQNVASFLVSDLGLDWTWGAAYFESKLIDYDPCSNWGNWNYVAGVGNDPRQFSNGQPRYFNILSQALRYDERGDYVKHWLPELAKVPNDQVHLVSNLTAQQQEQYGVVLGQDYPLPVVDPNKWVIAPQL